MYPPFRPRGEKVETVLGIRDVDSGVHAHLWSYGMCDKTPLMRQCKGTLRLVAVSFFRDCYHDIEVDGRKDVIHPCRR